MYKMSQQSCTPTLHRPFPTGKKYFTSLVHTWCADSTPSLFDAQMSMAGLGVLTVSPHTG